MKILHLQVNTTYYERLWGYIYLAFELMALPLILESVNLFFNLRLSDADLNFLYFSLNFIFVTVIFHRFLLENGKIALQSPANILISAATGYLLYRIATIAISAFLLQVYPAFYNVNDSNISQMVASQYELMLIGTVLLVPITEELLYRGLIFNGLYEKNRILAFIVSTLAFAGLHVYGYIGTYPPIHLLCCLLEYVPAGIFLAWAYAKTDSIITPILIHICVNSAGVLAMR